MNILNYQETFSATRAAVSIEKYAFPCVKRGPAIKCHDVKPWLQTGSQSPVIHYGEDKSVIERINALAPQEIHYYKTPQGTVDLNKKGISLAVERRISLFFQQAILCYKMSAFTFSAGGADAQIGTSPALALSSRPNSPILKREAAHSSTIPTLIAHAKDGSSFVFLKGGSSYAQHNSTIGMSECVNGADELIDGKSNQAKLRDTAVKILNRVAGGLDPIKATKEFIEEFHAETVRTAQNLDDSDARKKVLGLYAKKIVKVTQAAQDKNFFDYLIGVNINPGDAQESILRNVLYKKRYDIIRLQEVIESRIGKRLFDAAQGLGRNKNLFIFAVMEAFSEKKEKEIIQKLFCKSKAYLDNSYLNQIPQKDKAAYKTFRTKVSKVHSENKQLIEKLTREMRLDFRELSQAELSFRAGLFKDLRTKVRDWTQVEFRDNFLATTGRAISQSWVSRMEQLTRTTFKNNYSTPISQRRRTMSLKEAQECADTFEVDVGVFLPCLFVS